MLNTYLLAVQVSSILIHILSLTQSVRQHLVASTSLCSPCVTYWTPCYPIGHQVLPTQLYLGAENFPRGWQVF